MDSTITYADLFDAAPAAQTLADELGEPCYVRKERATGLLVIQSATPVDGRRFLTVWGPAEPTTTECEACHYPHDGEHCPNPACLANPSLSDEVKAGIVERREQHLADVAEREQRMRLWGQSFGSR